MKVQINGTRKTSELERVYDEQGHRVVMIEAKSDGRIVWHWSDGAITNENFYRGQFFNFVYSLIKFYRKYKLLIKMLFICFGVYMGYIAVKNICVLISLIRG